MKKEREREREREKRTTPLITFVFLLFFFLVFFLIKLLELLCGCQSFLLHFFFPVLSGFDKIVENMCSCHARYTFFFFENLVFVLVFTPEDAHHYNWGNREGMEKGEKMGQKVAWCFASNCVRLFVLFCFFENLVVLV